MNADRKSNLFRKESLERLSSPEQLDQLMQIVTPKSWLPLGALGVLIVGGILWSLVGRIPITVTGEGLLVRSAEGSDDLIGVTYFSKSEGDRIQPGMDILLLPAGISDHTGGIEAQVKTVAASPFETLDDIRQAQSTEPGTPQAAPLQDMPIEVIATLRSDDSTMSGYDMSSPSSAQMYVEPGTSVTARVTVDSRAPISFVFPFLNP